MMFFFKFGFGKKEEAQPKSAVEEHPELRYTVVCAECLHKFTVVGRALLNGTAGCPQCVQGGRRVDQ